MRRASRKFSPPLWGTLATLAATALFAWAGLWQLERGDEKRQLFADFDSLATAEPLAALVGDELATGYRYRRFLVRGRYDNEHQILLDSMTHDGRVGYHVLTPLLMSTTAVLINRGWVPADPDRSVLPEVAVGTQPRYVRGRLDLLPRPGIRAGSGPADGPDAWPRRLLFPTPAQVEQQLGIALYDYQLLLDEADPDGFVRSWRPALMSPERHLGYAVQWFAFAVALWIIYFVVNLRKTNNNE